MNKGAKRAVYAVSALLLCLAAGCFLAFSQFRPSKASLLLLAKSVDTPALGKEDSHLDKTPPRSELGLDLRHVGWKYDCMECHQHVDSPRYDRSSLEVEHEDIELNHGNNRYCLNCHHQDNKNAFVDYDGSEIAEQDVTQLCSKCHGPAHRDWLAGAHGRQNGYWDAASGPKTKLRCIQCHDPHSPAFAPMKPLPPPSYPKRAPHSKQ